jgi:hypothetical protein
MMEPRARARHTLLSLAMRNLPVLAVAVVGLFACEERFSSNPPPLAAESLAPASSSNAIEALLAPSTTDAGPSALGSSRALTVTICSSNPQACPASDADASATGTYRVVFGSGRGAIRSRGQAMADLYKELRDRTSSGERLNAQPVAPGDAGASAGGGSTTRGSADSSDPIAQSALHLLDLVDGVGEVTVDVIHGRSTGCMVSLGRLAADGGAPQCLVREPERPKGRGKGGLSF